MHVSKAASQGREQAASRMVGDTCDTADNRRQTVRGITSCSCVPQYNCRLGYGKQFTCNDRPYLHTALVFCDKSATRHTRCMSEVLLAPESQCRFWCPYHHPFYQDSEKGSAKPRNSKPAPSTPLQVQQPFRHSVM